MSVCLYSCLSYPACKSHTFCVVLCHLWPGCLYYIFPHYLINGTIFGKKLLSVKCVFRFSLQGLSLIFLILRIIQRDIINIHRSSCKVPIILVRFYWNLKFPRYVFEKYSNIKFHENPSSGSLVVPCGQTDGRRADRHDEVNSRFSKFWERS
jgi:hypothetical protein